MVTIAENDPARSNSVLLVRLNEPHSRSTCSFAMLDSMFYYHALSVN